MEGGWVVAAVLLLKSWGDASPWLVLPSQHLSSSNCMQGSHACFLVHVEHVSTERCRVRTP